MCHDPFLSGPDLIAGNFPLMLNAYPKEKNKSFVLMITK